jgi:hypothetical protein
VKRAADRWLRAFSVQNHFSRTCVAGALGCSAGPSAIPLTGKVAEWFDEQMSWLKVAPLQRLRCRLPLYEIRWMMPLLLPRCLRESMPRGVGTCALSFVIHFESAFTAQDSEQMWS